MTKDIMTQEQARELLVKLRFVIQKTRSDLAEAVELKPENYETETDPGFIVMNDLYPYLFPAQGKISLLKTAQMVMDKETIEPIDMYNLLWLTHQVRPVVLCYNLIQEDELPDAMSAMTRMLAAVRWKGAL